MRKQRSDYTKEELEQTVETLDDLMNKLGYPRIVRDHLHCDESLWVDEVRGNKIRTTCRLCGDLIGYRDNEEAQQ